MRLLGAGEELTYGSASPMRLRESKGPFQTKKRTYVSTGEGVDMDQKWGQWGGSKPRAQEGLS
jgi:hypothetical protein